MKIKINIPSINSSNLYRFDMIFCYINSDKLKHQFKNINVGFNSLKIKL